MSTRARNVKRRKSSTRSDAVNSSDVVIDRYLGRLAIVKTFRRESRVHEALPKL